METNAQVLFFLDTPPDLSEVDRLAESHCPGKVVKSPDQWDLDDVHFVAKLLSDEDRTRWSPRAEVAPHAVQFNVFGDWEIVSNVWRMLEASLNPCDVIVLSLDGSCLPYFALRRDGKNLVDYYWGKDSSWDEIASQKVLDDGNEWMDVFLEAWRGGDVP